MFAMIIINDLYDFEALNLPDPAFRQAAAKVEF